MPVETPHAVGARSQVDVSLAGYGLSHVRIDMQCVARHVDGHVRTADGQAVGIDAPQRFRCRRINGRRVAQGDVQLRVRYARPVHRRRPLVQVDAVRAQPQFADVALHPQVADEAVGVHLRLVDAQLVDDHPIVKQRSQLHVHRQMPHVGQRVALMDDAEVVDA